MNRELLEDPHQSVEIEWVKDDANNDSAKIVYHAPTVRARNVALVCKMNSSSTRERKLP